MVCGGTDLWQHAVAVSGGAIAPYAIPTDVDFILLSQGLPDHCHEPTLRACDRALPVIASPSAAKVAQSLGFETVIALSPHQTHTYRDLTIQATERMPVLTPVNRKMVMFYAVAIKPFTMNPTVAMIRGCAPMARWMW